ncbi:DUF2062 domain-containing protein [Paenibacillus sp. JCM 10914]|uniref:DUF2062 domain-containing protein n=1 Tax=Paenibacillus sp. JCM 10914 TaxID=1236974 RepID=UPI0003CC695D|nr:DUF2062 domain-containing protein [Paenibacillus sp. JCM 10914]GAE05772.1 hypothetical protein JCM10914_1894 [Paenibacillus sp. JCM 10914]
MLHKYIRKFKYYLLRTLRMQNSDHRIALGFAVGFFPCWFPTFGIDLLLAPLLARLVKGNIPSAFLAATTGSVLWPGLFYWNYKVGVMVHLLTTYPRSFEIEDAITAPIPETDYIIETDHFGIWGIWGSISSWGPSSTASSLRSFSMPSFALYCPSTVNLGLTVSRNPLNAAIPN